jgi:hypothetical protein
MTRENIVKKKVKEVLKELGAYYVMPMTGGYGKSGAPDFIICWKGMFFGVECKAGSNTATELQLRNLQAIREAKGAAIVINENNVDKLSSWMKEHADTNGRL